MPHALRVVILKPSRYGVHGYVDRFRRGFMPNSTVPYIRSMTPQILDGVRIETYAIDEYVQTDLNYLDLLRKSTNPTLLALVGVQSHQFHRSLDLAALALANGVEHCIVGGPHVMTCDTSMLYGRGISFALAEAEMIWTQILLDAIQGELAPVYGADNRWQRQLEAPVLMPPEKKDLARYVVPMLGIYPARGCPFTCNFCSVIKIAGHRIRSQEIETTMASLHAAKAAGVRLIMFTSDNFNKYPDATDLLRQMIEERIRLPFFVQCDTQISKQPEFVELLGRAGCFQIFVGVESFSRKALLSVHKAQNHPELYGEIIRLCREHRITSHFSNIIGFPDDTAKAVDEHVNVLRQLRPDSASFYVLTPIPGTQQYDDFLKEDWITEKNLDRFDTTDITWRHPQLGAEELRSLLFSSYRKFYSSRQILATSWHVLQKRDISPGRFLGLTFSMFQRISAWRKVHPMSGGVGHVYRDHTRDYQRLRRETYGYDLVPLPNSLGLSESDAAFNRVGKNAAVLT